MTRKQNQQILIGNWKNLHILHATMSYALSQENISGFWIFGVISISLEVNVKECGILRLRNIDRCELDPALVWKKNTSY